MSLSPLEWEDCGEQIRNGLNVEAHFRLQSILQMCAFIIVINVITKNKCNSYLFVIHESINF